MVVGFPSHAPRLAACSWGSKIGASARSTRGSVSLMLTLPAGTVSFLFTDIEGSTRLLEEHPQEMGAAMSRHHDLLQQAVEANGGIVFETLGDGVYASFTRASDGVRAAIEGQQAIRAEKWGAVGEIRVRMGLHTGDVQVRG